MMKERMEELEAWLESLTEPQLRAYACQKGVEVWRTASVVKLRGELCSQLLAEVMEVVE
jgi:hypothetical protein